MDYWIASPIINADTSPMFIHNMVSPSYTKKRICLGMGSSIGIYVLCEIMIYVAKGGFITAFALVIVGTGALGGVIGYMLTLVYVCIIEKKELGE